jgi:hypothetical protein
MCRSQMVDDARENVGEMVLRVDAMELFHLGRSASGRWWARPGFEQLVAWLCATFGIARSVWDSIPTSESKEWPGADLRPVPAAGQRAAGPADDALREGPLPAAVRREEAGLLRIWRGRAYAHCPQLQQ